MASGISNRMSGEAERAEAKAIRETWQQRSARKTPGTHTLGKEFDTKKAPASTIA